MWLGAVFSIFYLFVAFGNRIARMVVAKFGSLSAVYLQVGLLGVGYLIMAAWTTSLGWLAIALPRTVFGMTSYLQASNINAAVSDDRRATVHSAASFTARVVYAGLLFLSGAFIGDWPLSSVFLALAGYTVVLSAFVVVFGSRVYFLRESAA